MNAPDTRRVVLGVDGGPGGAGALRYAVAEARRRGVPLHLVHVLPVYPPVGSALPGGIADLGPVGTAILETAAQTVRELAPDLEVHSTLRHGSRAAGLVESSQDAQLVVVGRETRHGLDRVLTGTTTAGVAARAACEVVVVPSFWMPDRPHGRVVVGLKAQDNPPGLLARAFAEAAAHGAALSVVSAWYFPDAYLDRIEVRTHASDWEAEGHQVLDVLVDEVASAYPDVAVDVRVVHGRPTDVLMRAARESDLLLVARRRHATPPYGHLGGVPHALVRTSEVPVGVVPFAGEPQTETGLALEASGQG